MRPDESLLRPSDRPPDPCIGSTMTERTFLKGFSEAFNPRRRFRERFKIKKAVVEVEENKKKGPLIVSHETKPVDCSLLVPLGSPANLQPCNEPKNVGSGVVSENDVILKAYRRISRTPSPKNNKSGAPPFLRSNSFVGHSRQRSPSNQRSRPNSPSMKGGLRSSSPYGSLDNVYVEAVRKRLEKAKKVRLYLLRQVGPYSFVVGADSPENLFKISIGSQTCTCGHGPHCIHLLFFMLRVLHVTEKDPRFWSKELKNFELESLFASYEERKKLRIEKAVRKTAAPMTSMPTTKNGVSTEVDIGIVNAVCAIEKRGKDQDDAHTEKKHDNIGHDEIEDCSICLLEMIDCESLVTCTTGCRNRLHHHCMSIWADECRRNQEPVLCPLCRHPWQKEKSVKESNGTASVTAAPSAQPPVAPSPPLQSPFSPTAPSPRRRTPSPAARSAVEQFYGGLGVLDGSHSKSRFLLTRWRSPRLMTGEWCGGIVGGISSPDWTVREIALKSLNRYISEEAEGGVLSEDCLEQCCLVLIQAATDRVYNVYLACLQCLRTLLSYIPLETESHLVTLQDLIRPVVHTIILRCCDDAKKTTELSISTIVEMCKGQSGGFAVGSMTQFPANAGLGGLNYILKCIFEDQEGKKGHSWHWKLGRLYILKRLLDEFPQEFDLVLLPRNSLVSDESYFVSCPIKSRRSRFETLLRFVISALDDQHINVVKQAREVFLKSARFAVRVPDIFDQMIQSASVDSVLVAKFDQWRKARTDVEIEPATTPMIIHPQQRNQHRGCLPKPKAPWVPPSAVRNSPCMRRFEPVGGTLPNKTSQQHTKKRPDYLPLDGPLRDVLDWKSPENPVGSLVSPRHRPYMPPSHRASTPPALCRDPIRGLSFRRVTPGNSPKMMRAALGCEPIIKSAPSGRKGTAVPAYLLKAKRQFNSTLGTALPSAVSVGGSKKSCPATPPKKESPLSPSACPPPPSPEDNALENTEGERKKVQTDVEEALKFTRVFESSLQQEELTFIPGLMQYDENGEIVVHQEPEDGESIESMEQYAYVEGVHWIKGHILGNGGFSTCFQARDLYTGTLMAVKQVTIPCKVDPPDEGEKIVSSIKEEFSLMARVDHPNIVRIYGATQQINRINMFVEWLPGGSVSALLETYGPFSEKIIVNYTRQVLAGLTCLHEHHILHRDLKGANLLVDSSGQHLRIGDFGAATHLISQATITGEFQGQILGTIAFMAPEVLRGDDYGRLCDVWSVGCVMIEMATTKPPWISACDLSNQYALIYKIARTEVSPPIPSFLSESTRDLALRCLEVKAEDRPPARMLLKHPVFQMFLNS